jgi:D-lactate dehydrogenase
MKNTAVLINTARGELIDTQALYNALVSNEILGAGLDVLESEETMSDPDYLTDINRLNEWTLRQTVLNTRLLQLPNAVITPHFAYNTKEAVNRILSITMDNINSFSNGTVKNCVY